MEFIKSTTALICILSLAISAFSALVSFEKYSFLLKTIFTGVMILCVIEPIINKEIAFEPIFESKAAGKATYDYSDDVINEAVRQQTKINLEKAACQILSDYEIAYKDLNFDVNIDSQGCISISNVSLKSDSPLTAGYALRKIFGENSEIEVSELE